VQQVKSLIATDLFPNINGTIKEKAKYLGYLVSIMMKTALRIMLPSDRDSYVFKRVDISGILLAQLFQETYSKFRKNVRNILDQEYNYGPVKNDGRIEKLIDNYNIHRVFQANIITEIFSRSLKGMWGPAQDDPEQGLVQDLSRISYIGFLSHLRRVNMPLDRTIKITSQVSAAE
jgi:DNA-directed RNA polymerase II subunit RPB2